MITSHNDAEFLPTAIASVRQQGFDNWECIIVDDCSIDDSLRIALEAEAADSRISALTHETNLGLATARNTGVAHATGRFVTFLDADDFMFQDSIAERLVVAEEAVAADAAAAGSWCQPTLVPESADLTYPPGESRQAGVISFATSRGENPVIATTPLVLRSVVESLHGFREDLTTAEDFEFWMRLLRNGFVLYPTAHTGIAYRQKRSSMISRGQAAHARTAMRIYESMRRRITDDAVSTLAVAPLHQHLAGIPSRILQVTRLLQFLTFALSSGAEDQAAEIVAMIPTRTLQRIIPVLNVDGAIGLALNREELRQNILPGEKAAITQRVKSIVADQLAAVDATDPATEPLPARRHELVPRRDHVIRDGQMISIRGTHADNRVVTNPSVTIELAGRGDDFASVDLCSLAAVLLERGVSVAVTPRSTLDSMLVAHFGLSIAEPSAASLVLASRDGDGIDVVVHLGQVITGPSSGHTTKVHIVRSALEAEVLEVDAQIAGWATLPDLRRSTSPSSVNTARCLLFDCGARPQDRIDDVPFAQCLRGMDWIVASAQGETIRAVTPGVRRRLLPIVTAVVVPGGVLPADALLSGIPIVALDGVDNWTASHVVSRSDVANVHGFIEPIAFAAHVRQTPDVVVGRSATWRQADVVVSLL